MWTVFVNGSWHELPTDDVLRQWALAGHIRPDTMVRHASWVNPMPAGPLQALAGAWPGAQSNLTASSPAPTPGEPPLGMPGVSATVEGRAASADGVHHGARIARDLALAAIVFPFIAPFAVRLGLKASTELRQPTATPWKNAGDARLAVRLGGFLSAFAAFLVIRLLVHASHGGFTSKAAADDQPPVVDRSSVNLVAPSEPPRAKEPKAEAPLGLKRIKREGSYVGATTKAKLEKAEEIVASGDLPAFRQYLKEEPGVAIMQGGLEVLIVDVDGILGPVKVRKRGGLQEVWVPLEALE